tara:strand:- start:2947 stop:3450 length:504 start_codon:yes stop_codon:yes gene_type:complete
MPTTFYSDSQRKYWAQKPADVLKFETVEFYHPDFGYIRLVGNQFSDKTLDGDLYQAVSMDFPQVTNQTSDTTKAGSLQFGRIGTNIREKLKLITPMGGIKYPITAILRCFEEGVTAAIYERQYFVGKNGININADSVVIALAVDNPSKLTNKTKFYDPTLWKGLQSM